MPQWWSSYFVDIIIIVTSAGGGREEEVAFTEYGGKSPLAGLATCLTAMGSKYIVIGVQI